MKFWLPVVLRIVMYLSGLTSVLMALKTPNQNPDDRTIWMYVMYAGLCITILSFFALYTLKLFPPRNLK